MAHPKNRTVIVAALDQTAASASVIDAAVSFASSVANAELHFVHIVELMPMVQGPYVPPVADSFREARAFVDGITRDVASRFGGKISAHLGVGTPYKQVLQLASDLEADLVVVGTHGKGTLERCLVGSVSRAIVKHAACAVLVARPKEYASAPEIEPPCPSCLEVQRSSSGETLWCARHATRHVHGRLHYEVPESFAVGSMFIRP